VPESVKIFYSPLRGIPYGLVADREFRAGLLMKINRLALMARRAGSVKDSDTSGCPPSTPRTPHKRDGSPDVVSPGEFECEHEGNVVRIFTFLSNG
jgi:hypothetical protein